MGMGSRTAMWPVRGRTRGGEVVCVSLCVYMRVCVVMGLCAGGDPSEAKGEHGNRWEACESLGRMRECENSEADKHVNNKGEVGMEGLNARPAMGTR